MRISRVLSFAVVALSVIFVTSCNSDIFIEEGAMPDETDVFVAGDDGHAEFRIQPKGLKQIYIVYIGSDLSPFRYFNSDGVEVDMHSPASEISEIYCHTPLYEFRIGVLGNKVSVYSFENCSGRNLEYVLRLEYDYAVKYVKIHINAGKPLELLHWSYDGDMEVDSNVMTKDYGAVYNNSGQNRVIVYIKPYQIAQGKGVVEPEEAWAQYLSVNLPVPVYLAGEWCYGDLQQEIELGTVFYFSPFDSELSVPVMIPAYSSVKVVCTVSFSETVANGTMTFVAPVGGHEHESKFTCKVMQPTDYHIEVIEQ